MNDTIIIFDGNLVHEIKKEYFFQDHRINNLNKYQVKSILDKTKIYLRVLNEMIYEDYNNLIDEAKDDSYIKRVKDGLSYLDIMIFDMFNINKIK